MELVCPKPAFLETVLEAACPENIGQIQKFIFQRAGHVFESPTNLITVQASWTPLLTATDDTKVIISPWLEGVTIPSPEPITEGGGDNSTLNGRELIVGENNAIVSGFMRMIPGRILKILKKLAVEAVNGDEMVWYAITEYNKILCRTLTPSSPTDEITGIPLHALFVSDSGNEGKNTQDKAPIRFGVDYGWRDDLVIATATDFSPKAVLRAPVES